MPERHHESAAAVPRASAEIERLTTSLRASATRDCLSGINLSAKKRIRNRLPRIKAVADVPTIISMMAWFYCDNAIANRQVFRLTTLGLRERIPRSTRRRSDPRRHKAGQKGYRHKDPIPVEVRSCNSRSVHRKKDEHGCYNDRVVVRRIISCTVAFIEADGLGAGSCVSRNPAR